ncbi:MAG: toll/interleukin-1 receptor domain-containing protein [Lachnospiraceae bacterium]|nr:toll/interleukin-1 receptor domain-containing protein [Lachnospiraceae bacterium]
MSNELEKLIFISHSSKDHPFAQHLTDELEAAGMGCFIAPRDIPYGNSWAERIAKAIESARVMIFIFSEESNQSDQVIREIELALHNGLTVITLRITDQPYNRALSYYLSTLHWAKVNDLSDETVIKTFVKQVNGYLHGEAIDPTPGSHLQVASQASFNIDDALTDRFQELFGNGEKTPEPPKLSPMREKLLKRICENYVKHLEEASEETDPSSAPEPGNAKNLSFTMPETEGLTACYAVMQKYDLPDYTVTYYPIKCDREVQTSEEQSVESTFYLPEEAIKEYNTEGGIALMFLTHFPDRNVMLINAGLLEESTVKIAKQPMTMQFTRSDQDGPYRRVKHRANEQSSIVTIDIDTMEPVPRYRAYDPETNQWQYFMDLDVPKKYFAFQLNSSGGQSHRAKPYEIGFAYYHGLHGLPKNTLDAAEWLDQSATPRAYRLLAEIFKTDPLLRNEEDAAYYESLANETE